MDTPWGVADYIKEFEPGICRVQTPSHGGICVELEYAERNLTSQAMSHGYRAFNRLWYEEDCDWAIPALELPCLRLSFWSGCPYVGDEWIENLVQTLSPYRPTYLLERDICPDAERFDYYLLREAGYHGSIRAGEILVDRHLTGRVLALADPLVWSETLAFPQAHPDPLLAAKHVLRCAKDGSLGDHSRPVEWRHERQFKGIHWHSPERIEEWRSTT